MISNTRFKLIAAFIILCLLYALTLAIIGRMS